jgi:hypothetical protein
MSQLVGHVVRGLQYARPSVNRQNCPTKPWGVSVARRSSSNPSSFWKLVFACLLAIGCPTPSFGQANTDVSMDELLAKATSKNSLDKKKVVLDQATAPTNLEVHWQLWKRLHDRGRTGQSEITAMLETGQSLGLRNQTSFSMALLGTAFAEPDPQLARKILQFSSDLAPDLPYPRLALASHAMRHDITQLNKWGPELIAGLSLLPKWLPSAYPWAVKLLLYGMLAFVFASFAFILGQSLRYIDTATADLTSRLPQGFTQNQTLVLCVGVALIPGLVARSIVISALILVIVFSLFQRIEERMVSVLVLSVCAAAPLFSQTFSHWSNHATTGVESLFLSQHAECDTNCQAVVDRLAAERPGDDTVLYTQLLTDFRKGTTKSVQRVVDATAARKWSPEVLGYGLNLQGAALVALGRYDSAIEVLESARKLLATSAAPSFNLMRLYQVTGAREEVPRILTDASDRDLTRVLRAMRTDRRDANSYLMVDPLPIEFFWRFSDPAAPQAGLVTTSWTLFAGKKLTMKMHSQVALGGLFIVFLGLLLRLRFPICVPCPSCGMARRPADQATVGNHAFCVSCYLTFMAGGALDYETRIYNEVVLRRRRSMGSILRRTLSVLLPGTGHHMAGRSLTGFAITASLVFAALILARPMGIIRPSQELFTANWCGQITLSWIVLSVALMTVTHALVRDVLPVEHGVNSQ